MAYGRELYDSFRGQDAMNKIAAIRRYKSRRKKGLSFYGAGVTATVVKKLGKGRKATSVAITKKIPRRALVKSGVKTLKSQVRELKKAVASDQAYHTHRRREALDIVSAATQCSYTSVGPTNLSILEGSMANLRYYDPATPGTLITADGATGNYTRQIHFASIYKKIIVRNNYQVPVNVKIHSFVPKADTSTTPSAFYTAGLVDQSANAAAASDVQPLMYITDVDMVDDNWKIVKTVSRLLEPGRQISCYHSVKSFDYDPSNADTHALTYQRKYGAHIFVVRLEGALGHMPSTDVQGTLPSEVDCIVDWTFKIIYDAGVNLKDFSVNNTAGAVDATALVSNKPIADNQTISTT